MFRRGVDVDVQAAFGALGLHVLADDDGSRKARPVFIGEGEGLAAARRSRDLLSVSACAALCALPRLHPAASHRRRGLLAAADHGVARRNAHADGGSEAVGAVANHGEPASGVEQIGDGIADVGELQIPARGCRRPTGLRLRIRRSACRMQPLVSVAGSEMRTVESWLTRSTESDCPLASITRVGRSALCNSKVAMLISSSAVNLTRACALIWCVCGVTTTWMM